MREMALPAFPDCCVAFPLLVIMPVFLAMTGEGRDSLISASKTSSQKIFFALHVFLDR